MRNNTDVRNMLKDAGILFAITLIAGLLLGFVYELTKEPIAAQEVRAIVEACREVFTDAVEFTPLEVNLDEDLLQELSDMKVAIGTIYDAKDGSGNHLGYVLQTTSKAGYSGNITLYMGVREDGILNGISLLDISETSGLGMQAEKVLVPQYLNKKVDFFTYTKTGSRSDSEIDAISGATITTKAVNNAVNGGLKVVSEALLEGGAANE